jgi:hypothetical protein
MVYKVLDGRKCTSIEDGSKKRYNKLELGRNSSNAYLFKGMTSFDNIIAI